MCCWTVPRKSATATYMHTLLRSLFIPFSWVVTSLANQKESHDPRHKHTQTCKLNTFMPQRFKLKHAHSATRTAKCHFICQTQTICLIVKTTFFCFLSPIALKMIKSKMWQNIEVHPCEKEVWVIVLNLHLYSRAL